MRNQLLFTLMSILEEQLDWLKSPRIVVATAVSVVFPAVCDFFPVSHVSLCFSEVCIDPAAAASLAPPGQTPANQSAHHLCNLIFQPVQRRFVLSECGFFFLNFFVLISGCFNHLLASVNSGNV